VANTKEVGKLNVIERVNRNKNGQEFTSGKPPIMGSTAEREETSTQTLAMEQKRLSLTL